MKDKEINKAKRAMIREIIKELSLKEKPIPKKLLKVRDAWLYEKAVDRLIGHNWAVKDMFAILRRLKRKYKI